MKSGGFHRLKIYMNLLRIQQQYGDSTRINYKYTTIPTTPEELLMIIQSHPRLLTTFKTRSSKLMMVMHGYNSFIQYYTFLII